MKCRKQAFDVACPMFSNDNIDRQILRSAMGFKVTRVGLPMNRVAQPTVT